MKKPDICERTRDAREKANLEQKDMPGLFKVHGVEVTPDAYNKYEIRTPIRQHLIPIFCKITDVNEKWLLTGNGPYKIDISWEQSIMDDLRQLDEAGRSAFEQMVKAWPKKS